MKASFIQVQYLDKGRGDIMKDIEKLREKRNRKVKNIKKRAITDIRKTKDETIKKLNLSKMGFIEKRAEQQKGEGRFL